MTNFLLAVHHGLVVFAVGLCAIGILTTWITTIERAEFREDVDAAFDASGWTLEAAAVQTQTARSRLSAQRNGHAPCSILGRMPDLPGLEAAFLQLRAKRHGFVLIKDVELQRLILAARAFFERRPAKKMEIERSA